MPVKWFATVFRHPISLVGLWLTTASALLFLIVFLADLLNLVSNPYLGIVFFLVLPGVFVFGLLLMPFGAWLTRRRVRRGLPAEHRWPRIDLNEPHHRAVALFVLLGTLGNVVVLALAAYRGVEYMESVSFCGQVCHSVMSPEFAAYRNGPHARVACVQCHIGPGAPWFVKSKLSGTRQVFAVGLNTYPRPIPSPVHNLRPARETCEECHWPEKFTGDKIATFREFADDEANTETTTTMRLHVGGGSEKHGVATGIHWHMDPSTRITYIPTDEKRQNIPWVRVEDKRGVRVFAAPGVNEADLRARGGQERPMDCMDCHNRPSHPFTATAERGVDGVMGFGRLPRTLPFFRRQAVAALKQSYPSQDEAVAAIGQSLRGFYQSQYAAQYAEWRSQIEPAIAVVQNVYRRNVFPAMKVTWGTYANNIGHQDFPGCFRCHDENHTSKDGKTIPQDCELCHQTLESGR
jgi:hypothetical protein